MPKHFLVIMGISIFLMPHRPLLRCQTCMEEEVASAPQVLIENWNISPSPRMTLDLTSYQTEKVMLMALQKYHLLSLRNLLLPLRLRLQLIDARDLKQHFKYS